MSGQSWHSRKTDVTEEGDGEGHEGEEVKKTSRKAKTNKQTDMALRLPEQFQTVLPSSTHRVQSAQTIPGAQVRAGGGLQQIPSSKDGLQPLRCSGMSHDVTVSLHPQLVLTVAVQHVASKSLLPAAREAL